MKHKYEASDFIFSLSEQPSGREYPLQFQLYDVPFLLLILIIRRKARYNCFAREEKYRLLNINPLKCV